MSDQSDVFVYVGTYDRTKSVPRDSFYIFRYLEGGKLETVGSAVPEVTVGATCVDARREILYCTDESVTQVGYLFGGGGRVFAFAIDASTGGLTEINHLPSYGSNPSYCAIDAEGKYLIVTHHTDSNPVTRTVKDESGNYRINLEYDDANLVLFPLGEDGSIGEPCDIYTATGDGGPTPQQTHPQLHSVTMSPSGKVFAICDKGCDRVLTFGIDRTAHKLVLLEDRATLPGASPRYSAFHPTRPYLFVNYEAQALVGSFRYDEDGKLEPICTISALPEGFAYTPEMRESDFTIDPAGKYLYSLIRGLNAVSVFAIDQESGQIEHIQTENVEGIMPRGCAVSPDERFLLIAAQMSDEVLVWAIGDGRLSPTGERVGVPEKTRPGTVTFFPSTTGSSKR